MNAAKRLMSVRFGRLCGFIELRSISWVRKREAHYYAATKPVEITDIASLSEVIPHKKAGAFSDSGFLLILADVIKPL